ncbi:MAG: hypothetical protein ACOX3E_07595 [Desulfomonilia bacterium]|jgi:hypothetical protein|uniref:Uncharacterized protein n=1 Tax=anaerobic digester metagenome TaxID=1263854 RepID=A0A485LUK6_9ZZZZ|nr:hypothetical protein [Pseudomonadota bacterium]HPD20452.1 hypothetical protein [Deltaproteobacteria bacterium]HPX18869.1 hypothetical protein [Deltaproteobacteria bacterium]HRS55383.1 hypothetical protein [Desulfomonilia bacterium]HRV34592.1 hypothetical protein [Desulfomonilia bacterium]
MGSIPATGPLGMAVKGILNSGLSQLRKKTMGRGIWGLAIPVAIFVIEDISRPDGVILPAFKWVLNKTAKVRIVEVSARSPRTSPDSTGDAPEAGG